MNRPSDRMPRIKLRSVEAVLLLTLCLLVTMVGIGALRVRLVSNIAHAVHANSSYYQGTMPPAGGMAPVNNTAAKASSRTR